MDIDKKNYDGTISRESAVTSVEKSQPNLNLDGYDTTVSQQHEPSEQTIEIEKFEPGIILYYKTASSETVSVQKNVVIALIKDKIGKLNISNGTIDAHYELLIDLTSDELTSLIGKVEIAKTKDGKDFILTTPSLKNIGLKAERVGDMQIRLSGTPKNDFNGKLFFYVDFNRSTLTPTNKQKCASFMDLSPVYVDSKPFIINAHPKSLWNDCPVEDYEGYQNLDNKSNGETVEYVPSSSCLMGLSTTPAKSFEVIAASARGRSHAHVGKPRDDAFHYEFDKETGWNFIAVADGAGSAKYSRKGSELATYTVIHNLRETLTKEFNQRCFYDKWMSFQRWKNKFLESNTQLSLETENEFVENTQFDKVFHRAVDAAYRAIHEEHKRREDSVLKDYHTTLLCAAFRWFPELDRRQGGWFIASYWVGDGGAAILRPMFDGISTDRISSNSELNIPKDRVFVLGEPDGGEFAGQTRFLTMPEEITAEKIRSRCRFSFCDSFESIILVSDGITDPFFPSEAAVVDEPRWLEFYEKKLKDGCEEEPNGCKEVFADNIAPNAKAEALLKWLGFWSKGNHDDRTILIVRPQ
jgi:serine/threonine protein phosphatase PrpC